MTDYEFGILEGGPMDGQRYPKGLLDLNVRYFTVPYPSDASKFSVYERIERTNRLKFIQWFENVDELNKWTSEHRQERHYT